MMHFAHYEIDATLHDGARHTVLRGRRRADGAPVVIKLIAGEHPSARAIQRFRFEYETLKRLDSERVVRGYGFEQDQQRWLLVQESIELPTLAEVIRQGQSDLSAKLDIALGLVRAIDVVHRQHVIHKDINPSNVLCAPDGEQVKLIDFGIATQLSRETPTFSSSRRLEGTLAYIAPEQTGRVRAAVDYRSDFYSLGATLYQLFTGQRPFDAADPLELVHCHIAQHPQRPDVLEPSLPTVVASIVMRLMEKSVDARYQTTAGLLHDLERCAEQLDEGGAIEDFPLGSADVAPRLQFPARLFGRGAETARLLAALEHTAGAEAEASPEGAELILVTGGAGMGKTALIRELYGPLTRQRGYYISGKAEQLTRTPLAPMVAAFRQLLDEVLGESDETVARLRRDLEEALGPNGRVLTEIIPQVELLIGPQPEAPPLGPTEARNRLERIFREFVFVFAKPYHPVVLFVDDLQWCDGATLTMLEQLASDGREGLLIVGAYRDNEIDDAHPLTQSLARLGALDVSVVTLALRPLKVGHVASLIEAITGLERQEVQPLAELVHRLTEGNPLWVREYLESLAEDDLITFTAEEGRWRWELDRIERHGTTENVLELMASKVTGLPENTRRALQTASCFGSRFSLGSLASVLGCEPRECFDRLLPAMNGGIVFAPSALSAQLDEDAGECSFFHDRLQQAAYGLLSESTRAELHARIGRHLRASARQEDLSKRVFDIVDQLDRGLEHITSADERMDLCRLNLLAGQRARAASALEAAGRYLSLGMELLPPEAWETHYELSMSLHRELALAVHLQGDHARSDSITTTALEHARTELEQADILVDLVHQYTTAARYGECIEQARRGLALLGHTLESEDILGAMQAAFGQVQQQMGAMRPADLLDRPIMTDPTATTATRLLWAASAPAFYTDPLLYSLIIFRALGLMLEHGNPPHAFAVYPMYGHLLSAMFGDPQGGFEFGQLGIELSERYNSPQDRCLCSFFTANFLGNWVRPLKQQRAINDGGYQAGLEAGELTYAGYILTYIVHNAFYEGQELERVASLAAEYHRFNNKFGNSIACDVLDAIRLPLANLRGESVGGGFSCDGLDESGLLARCEINHSAMAVCYYRIFQADVLLRYGDRVGAVEALAAAEPLLPTILNNHGASRFVFLSGLALCEGLDQLDQEARSERLEKIAGHQGQLAAWTERCPANFGHQHALVSAELARVTGDHSRAISNYEDAIRLAETHGLNHDLALANELAGRFWRQQQRLALSRSYLASAHNGYTLWGAHRKAGMLLREFPELVQQPRVGVSSTISTISDATVSTSSGTSSGVLDLASVIRASQAISGEIVIERLLERLMGLVIENAGAQSGALLVEEEGELMLQATASLGPQGEAGSPGLQVGVQQMVPLSGHPDLPHGIIGYAARTGETVILADATTAGRFAKDPYVRKRQPRSVLCLPLLSHGRMMGLLYLENRVMDGAFTEDRLEILRLLSAQFTISFDNARLYAEMDEKVRRRTRELYEKNTELERTLDHLRTTQDRLVHAEKMASLGKLTAGVAHEINNPLNFVNNFSIVGLELLEEIDEVLAEGKDDAGEEIKDITSDLRQNITAISTHGKRAAGIVRRMLLHSRQSGGELVPTDLNALVQEYIKLAEFGLRDKKESLDIEVVLDLAEGLGEVDLGPQELGQVLVNLLNNAYDAVLDHARAHDDFAGRIQISTARDEGGVQIRIRDNGPGVPEEIRPRIFDPFFTTKAGTQGTGLGLSLCYDIVTQGHGGSLELEPGDGQGASFLIRLPAE
jgi:predicted ATPase/signal transduction histidine kinase